MIKSISFGKRVYDEPTAKKSLVRPWADSISPWNTTRLCNDLLELAVVATATKDIDLTDLALNMILTILHYAKSCRRPSVKAVARNRKIELCKFE